jgi:enamine deaminase RidA (YjgF/YER057c/UK114 family)
MAVKVTDAQGAPVKGVTLTWTASAGGSVKLTGPTDDTGLALALWTLGPSAAPQSLTVSHAQAAKSVVFAGYVPIGSVTANAAQSRKYIGDTLASYVTVKDTKGTVLTGPMRVVVRDESIARDAGTGALVGAGDLGAQTRQVFENIKAALEAAGASFADVIKLNIYMLDVSQVQVVRDIRDKYVDTTHPPASTLVEVRRLVRDEFLIEIDVVANTV